MPLIVGDLVVGAMNVYSRQRDVFDDRAAHMGELFAGRAAVAVRNAQILDHARGLAEQLQTALMSRAVIDQAVGILMSRRGATSAETLASLKRKSQSGNVKLNILAQQLVDEAVHRARARHTRR